MVNNLAYYRMKKGLRQEDAAEKLFMNVHSLSEYEAGNRIPRIDVAYAFADFYGCSIDDLYKHSVSSFDFQRVRNDYNFVLRLDRERRKENRDDY